MKQEQHKREHQSGSLIVAPVENAKSSESNAGRRHQRKQHKEHDAATEPDAATLAPDELQNPPFPSARAGEQQATTKSKRQPVITDYPKAQESKEMRMSSRCSQSKATYLIKVVTILPALIRFIIGLLQDQAGRFLFSTCNPLLQ